ncbi:transposable element Tc1 transposase [Trichonephila clavipes]|uniref:Transposable element Tc1 transposase n=1 Tax=Trichonephila clavipes TaxID=2585209 RepID=A0A8X6R895_TRICX|nr:transposable element Tc1 transposase [Trichonephila clavipes]
MVWGAISYHGLSNLLRIEGNFNSNRYVREVVLHEVIPLLQGVTEAIFQQIMHAHILQRLFGTSTQHMQRFSRSAYSPDMSPIEHVRDLVGRSCVRDLRPAASKDELLLRIKARWNSLQQADIQNLFDFMSCRIEKLIAARGGYTKY